MRSGSIPHLGACSMTACWGWGCGSVALADVTAKGQLPVGAAATVCSAWGWDGMGRSQCGQAPAPSCKMLNLLWATCALALQDPCKDGPKGFSFFLVCAP